MDSSSHWVGAALFLLIAVTAAALWLTNTGDCCRKQQRKVWSNEVVLISGGASGLGLEVVKLLTRAGATVAVLDVSVENINVAKKSCGSNEVLFIEGDASSLASWKEAKAAIAKTLKRPVTMVISNAGKKLQCLS